MPRNIIFSTSQAFCIVIAAFRTELFSTAVTGTVTTLNSGPSAASGNRDLPIAICFFTDLEDGDNFYGDRVCNNAIAGAVASILFAMGFMIIDLQMPCTTSTVTYYFTYY